MKANYTKQFMLQDWFNDFVGSEPRPHKRRKWNRAPARCYILLGLARHVAGGCKHTASSSLSTAFNCCYVKRPPDLHCNWPITGYGVAMAARLIRETSMLGSDVEYPV